jgi:Ca2+-transporting ATPase
MTYGTIACSTFSDYCNGANADTDCLHATHDVSGVQLSFRDLDGFESACLTCSTFDYVHNSIIFNTFIFCQVFNEYTSRNLFDDWNPFAGILDNYVFLLVFIVTVACQVMLIEVGGEFLKTSPLTLSQWLITIALGAIGLPIGMLMRWIPVKEDPKSFFDNTIPLTEKERERMMEVVLTNPNELA